MSITARPSSRYTIMFGMVPIVVRLVPATGDEDGPFHTVHAVDGGRISTIKRCKACSKDVESDACVQAIAGAAKDSSIIVTAEEVAALATSTRERIKLDQFPPEASIPRSLYEKPYYVVPDDDDSRASLLSPAMTRSAYWVLLRTLQASGRVALGKVAFKSRERIACLCAYDDFLMLFTLRMPGEIRPAPTIHPGPPTTEISLDIKLAQRLMDDLNKNSGGLIGPVLTNYTDDYGAKLRALVDLKRSTPGATSTANLGDTLKKSVARARRTSVRGTAKAA